jgi:hypothetical protein
MFADPIVCATDVIHGLVEDLGVNFAALDLLASSKRYGQVFIVWAVGEICLRCEGNPAPLASVAQTVAQGLIALLVGNGVSSGGVGSQATLSGQFQTTMTMMMISRKILDRPFDSLSTRLRALYKESESLQAVGIYGNYDTLPS